MRARRMKSRWWYAPAAFLLVPAGPAPAETDRDTISTDTVEINDINRAVIKEDTGASGYPVAFGYPPVLMSHEEHTGAGVTCVTCHHKHHNPEREKHCYRCHRGLSGMEHLHLRCGKCHVRERISTQCASCHGDTVGADAAMCPSGQKRGLREVIFSHVGHYPREERCARCHAESDTVRRGICRGYYPPMAECLTCHDRKSASGQCRLCHGELGPDRPKNHTARWVKRFGHGVGARMERKECLACHRETECDRCHRGQTSFAVHEPGYRFFHGSDVKSGEVRCGMCHESRLHCSRCHEGRR